ncbi:MAG: hypothetical protein H6965_15875 [Chromatiaceae bacterium]|nr:hypothetical protein [Chromatiaceae bacterium]
MIDTTRLAPYTLLTLLALLLTGCAQLPAQRQWSDDCTWQLERLHREALSAGVADVQAHQVGDYPYLRADRFLWNQLPQLKLKTQRREWTQLVLEFGNAALTADHANLSAVTPLTSLRACLQTQAEELAARPDYLLTLSEQPYPSEYSHTARVVGLYPITRHLMLAWLPALHQELRERYLRGPANPVTRYVPAGTPGLTADLIRRWLKAATAVSPLGLPRLAVDQQQRLLAHFAPVWRIETRASFDLPGVPFRTVRSVGVNSQWPVTYSYLSYSSWRGRALLQLNYLIWFDERPAATLLDIYAGKLDGMLLRLTLDQEGRPLLLDSIHPCGCYHSLIPLQPGVRLASTEALIEPPLLLDGLPEAGDAMRVSVALSSSDHMLLGVNWEPREWDGNKYLLLPADQLRSIATTAGRRNLFAPPFGLIPGSERSEALLLWPSGVVMPGTMRQWGHHAITFSNDRHFDDADLLEQLFVHLPIE